LEAKFNSRLACEMFVFSSYLKLLIAISASVRNSHSSRSNVHKFVIVFPGSVLQFLTRARAHSTVCKTKRCYRSQLYFPVRPVPTVKPTATHRLTSQTRPLRFIVPRGRSLNGWKNSL